MNKLLLKELSPGFEQDIRMYNLFDWTIGNFIDNQKSMDKKSGKIIEIMINDAAKKQLVIACRIYARIMCTPDLRKLEELKPFVEFTKIPFIGRASRKRRKDKVVTIFIKLLED